MTNNSDGLTPTLKPQLGVGFNRALPAPFGFDNGFTPDGVNDYLTSRNFYEAIPLSGCFEFWAKGTFSDYFGIRLYDTAISKSFGLNSYSNNGGRTQFGNATDINNVPISDFNLNGSGVIHWVLNYDLNSKLVSVYKNSFLYSSASIGAGTFDQTTFNVLVFCYPTRGVVSYQSTHLRIYSKQLSKWQIDLNYNGGVGNNPCETENLIVWWDFLQLETLDFSSLQDSSDLRLGLRDLSGHNRHGLPVNCDINPLSPTYCLKPF